MGRGAFTAAAQVVLTSLRGGRRSTASTRHQEPVAIKYVHDRTGRGDQPPAARPTAVSVTLGEWPVSPATRLAVVTLAVAFGVAVPAIARTFESPGQAALASMFGAALVTMAIIAAVTARGHALRMTPDLLIVERLRAPMAPGRTRAIPLAQIADVTVHGYPIGDGGSSRGSRMRYRVEASVAGRRRPVRLVTLRGRPEADLIADRVLGALHSDG